MLLDVRWDGTDFPFEGERSIPVHGIPVGARIVSARAVVTPVDPGDSFVERISFSGNAPRWGANKAQGLDFVEVDFRARRTLAFVTGTDLINTTLQIDPGGAYVEVNDRGALRMPEDDPFEFTAHAQALPSFVVARMKITRPAAAALPNLLSVDVRSVPENVSLRLGDQPPFHTFLGPLTEPGTSVDFTSLLTEFLATAAVDNGFFVVPIVLHSDTIARLQLDVRLDFVQEQRPLADAGGESVLDFQLDFVPVGPITSFTLPLPFGSQAVPGRTAVRLQGSFDESRIAFGTIVPVMSELAARITAEDRTSTPATARLQLVDSVRPQGQAQPFTLPESVDVTGIDLLLAPLTAVAQVQVDIREDLGGKPGLVSLLPAPVTIDLQRDPGAQPHWISAPLTPALQIPAGRTQWLVVQRSIGDVEWRAQAAADGPGLQQTQDGGLSWRTTAVGAAPLAAALFRLRHVPPGFTMPIHVFVGEAPDLTEVPLEQYEPLGRVDFVLDNPEFATAINLVLGETALRECQPVERVTNGELEDWQRTGTAFGAQRLLPELTDEPSAEAAAAISPDALVAYAVTLSEDAQGAALPTIHAFDAFCLHPLGEVALTAAAHGSDDVSTNCSLVANPSGGRLFAARQRSVWMVDARMRVEIGQFDATLDVTGLAAGGGRIFVARQTSAAAFEIVSFDEGELEDDMVAGQPPTSTPVVEGTGLVTGLAATPEGRTLVAVTTPVAGGTGTLLIWTLLARQTREVPLTFNARGVTLSPRADRAFIGNGTANRIQAFELATSVSSDGPELENPQTLSIATITGDRVVAWGRRDNENGFAQIIDIGQPLPVAWEVLEGNFTPVCSEEEFHIAGRLGLPALKIERSAVSQVVSVTAECEYDFSFWGAANAEGAVGEVIWRDPECASAGIARVPVQSVNAKTVPGRLALPLRPHTLRVTAPPGVAQAEIRFRTDDDVLADLDRISLKPPAGPVVNPDFLGTDAAGLPAGWTVTPADQLGLTFEDRTLRNDGLAAITVAQEVAVTAGCAFQLEWSGEVSHLAEPPIAAVRWVGATVAPTQVVLSEDGPRRRAGAGMVPEGVTTAEIALTLPGGSAVTTDELVLRTAVVTDVPISIFAEAPGTLAVSEFQVVTDVAPPAPPPPPPEGFCPPTKPGKDPSGEDCNYCVSCGADRPMRAHAAAAAADHRVVECAVCRAPHVRHAGGVHAGHIATLPRFAIAPHEKVTTRSARASALHFRRMRPARRPRPHRVPPPGPGPVAHPLTQLVGISGKERQALQARRLFTIDELALLDAAALAAILPSKSRPRAQMLIGLARKWVDRS